MSHYQPEDQEFEDLLRETPMGQEAPAELKRRLRAMAASRKIQTHSKWAPRFAFMSACAVVVIAVGMMLWPSTASAKSFQKVIDATNLTKAFSIVVNIFQNGKSEQVKVQGQGSLIDVQAPNGMHLQLDHDKLYFYQPEVKQCMLMKLGGFLDEQAIQGVIQQGIHDGLKEIDIKKMLGEFKEKYGDQNAKVSGVFEDNGQMVYTIELSSPKEAAHVNLTVDAETDLPIRIQVDDGNNQKVDMRLDFSSRVTIERIEDSLPKDVKINEMDFTKMIGEGMGAMTSGFNSAGFKMSAEQKRAFKEGFKSGFKQPMNFDISKFEEMGKQLEKTHQK